MTISLGRPPIWKIIKEAVENLGGEASHRDILRYIKAGYGAINEGTIRCQITICTVNANSRVHYPENGKPRKCDTRYDFLYSTSRGRVELYSPEKHGQWNISTINGKLCVVPASGSSTINYESERKEKKPMRQKLESTIYCPVCKKDVEIIDERSARCPLCDNKISELFEKELRSFLLQKWRVLLQSRTVRIREVEKNFDFVSSDMNYIGDAKFYKDLDTPAAKWSTIGEYVWLLQFTSAKNKFLIFGRDASVPRRWLKRHRSLIGDVKFYFFDHKNRDLQLIT